MKNLGVPTEPKIEAVGHVDRHAGINGRDPVHELHVTREENGAQDGEIRESRADDGDGEFEWGGVDSHRPKRYEDDEAEEDGHVKFPVLVDVSS